MILIALLGGVSSYTCGPTPYIEEVEGRYFLHGFDLDQPPKEMQPYQVDELEGHATLFAPGLSLPMVAPEVFCWVGAAFWVNYRDNCIQALLSALPALYESPWMANINLRQEVQRPDGQRLGWVYRITYAEHAEHSNRWLTRLGKQLGRLQSPIAPLAGETLIRTLLGFEPTHELVKAIVWRLYQEQPTEKRDNWLAWAVRLEKDAGKDTTPESYLDRMQAVLTALLR